MAVDVAPLAPPNAGPLHRLIRRTRVLLRDHASRHRAGPHRRTAPRRPGPRRRRGPAAAAAAAPLLARAHGCDSGLRLASLCLVVAPPAVAFLVGVVFPLFRRLTAGRVARRIEAHIPGIHNRLVSCIDLEARGRAAASPVFYRRLVTESLDRIRGFHASRVLDFVKLRRAGLVAVVGDAGVRCRLVPLLRPAAHGDGPHLPPLRRHSAGRRRGLHRRAARAAISCARRRSTSPPTITRGEAASLTLELRADNGADDAIPLEPVRDDPSSFQSGARHGEHRPGVPERLPLPRPRRRHLESALPRAAWGRGRSSPPSIPPSTIPPTWAFPKRIRRRARRPRSSGRRAARSR